MTSAPSPAAPRPRSTPRSSAPASTASSRARTTAASGSPAASAVLRRLAVVAGGPGTGKTTTVARIVALLLEQPSATPPLIALAAPTGKAAARLQEAVRAEADRLDVSADVREALLGLEASTLHRLLGWRPDSHSRFRHHRANRLPHDVVIVDETSMVSLSLMTKLIEAVRPDARLILVGDAGQLASVEAGAVLGDVVGPVVEGLRLQHAARDALASVTGDEVAAAEPPAGVSVGDGIVVLDRVHRYGGEIAALAAAIRAGDADETLRLLVESPDEQVRWLPVDAPTAPPEDLAPLRDLAVATGRSIDAAARAGDAEAALDALGAFRLLCAHRRGPHGAATWMAHVESWLAGEIDDFASEGQWYVGRPLLITENDYGLRLYNGDTGVVVETGPGRVAAAFRPRRRGALRRPRPPRRRRHRVRDDRPQGPGVAVRHLGDPPARTDVADPHARAALHGDHARPAAGAAHRRRGVGRRGGRAAGGTRLRSARAAVVHSRHALSRKS